MLIGIINHSLDNDLSASSIKWHIQSENGAAFTSFGWFPAMTNRAMNIDQGDPSVKLH